MTYIPGGGGGVSDGDKGDIVVASSGTSWTFDTGVVTAFAKTLLDDANATAARSTLGITGTGADTAYAFRANNLSDLASASTARSNLGLVIGTDVLGMGGGTLTGDLSVPDEAYDATGWDGNNEVPTKNAIRDKFESLSSGGLQKVSAVATDAQSATADGQFVPKSGSAPNASAASANNMTVTLTIASAQTVTVLFTSLFTQTYTGNAKMRFKICNGAGTVLFSGLGGTGLGSLYSVQHGEGSAQSVSFSVEIALAAGTHTLQVLGEYSLSAILPTYYYRSLAAFYTP